jgi:ribosomal protein L37E
MAIHEHAADVVIPSPTVEPFSLRKLEECRACGIRINSFDRITAFLKSSGLAVSTTRYCEGGKAPSEERNLVEQMMRIRESVNPCAGIFTPHLHVECRRCGFSFLMATSSAIERP